MKILSKLIKDGKKSSLEVIDNFHISFTCLIKKSGGIAFLYIIGVFFNSVHAQLNVTNTGNTATFYAQQLVGLGVTVSNATFQGANCGNGMLTSYQDGYASDKTICQIGTFSNGGSTNLNITDGLVLSSGDVVSTGKMRQFTWHAQYPSGMVDSPVINNDPDLNVLGGGGSEDCAILEFDFKPQGNSISFDYVFASSEYPGWVGQFNDVFGFFLSGPGISGTFSNNAVNIAQLPGGAGVVSINNVNGGSGPQGGCPDGSGTNSQYYVNNCNFSNNFPFRGFTTVLQATYSGLTCGKTYHIKIAISDIGDSGWDSAIFLKKNSLTSPGGSPTISVDPGDINMQRPINICKGDTVLLDATVSNDVGGTYSWTGSDIISGGGSNPTATVHPSVTTEYTVKYTYTSTGGACSTGTTTQTIKDTITVHVNPIPTLSVTDTTICKGEEGVLYSLTSPLGGTYSWQPTGGTKDSLVASPSATTDYTLIYSTPKGCSDTAKGTITVLPSPDFDVSGVDPTGCNTNDGKLIFTGLEPGEEYIITYGSTADTIIATSAGTDTVKNLGNTSFSSFHVTNASGCGKSLQKNIQLTAPGASSVAVAESMIAICPGDTATLSATGNPSGGTFEWSPTTGIINGYSSSDATIKVSIPDSTVYTVTYTKDGCASTAIVKVVIKQGSSTVQPVPDLCINDAPVTLQATPSGGAFSGDGISGATFSPASAGVGTHTITYTSPQSGGACGGKTTIQITVAPLPTAGFSAQPNPTTTANTEVHFTNTSSNATDYSWDFGDGSAGSSSSNPTHHFPNKDGNYPVILTASNSAGCTDTAQQIIIVKKLNIEYKLPNVFTPNGDGANDNFKFVYSKNIKTLHITILNRWGNSVFTSDDVDFKWNGKNKNSGGKCSDGTYFYKLILTGFNNKEYEVNGFVQLIDRKN